MILKDIYRYHCFLCTLKSQRIFDEIFFLHEWKYFSNEKRWYLKICDYKGNVDYRMCKMYFTNYKWLDIDYNISQENDKMTVANLKKQLKKVLAEKHTKRMQIQLHETIQIFVIHQ